MNAMLISFAAFAASLVGLAGLFFCWQQKQAVAAKRLLLGLSWLAIVFSLYLWSLPFGGEIGICYALMVLSLQAWALIWITEKNTSSRQSKTQAGKITLPVKLNWPAGIKAIPKSGLLLFACIPLAGFASLQLLVVLTVQLPIAKVDSMALGAYLMPVVWGCAAYWVCADKKMMRPVLVLLVISALSYGINYIL